MKFLFCTLAAAALCFAATESRVSRATILAVEHGIDEHFATISTDPYDVLGTARGTYLEGYGALFTTELDLVNAGPINISPFKPTVTPQEIASTHDRKLRKLAELKDSMRSLMADASGTLEGLPPNEHVAMEAILFYYSWENARDLPRRVFMTAEKQKLMEAKAGHWDQRRLAAIIEEQER